MEGNKIAAIRLEDGREFAGKIFIDASYEGDLLPGAKVSFTVGREANAAYNETSSGIQLAKSTKNQLPDGIDPYLVKGDPKSGLLPGVRPDAEGPDGSADEKLQAYCYRMVLTDSPGNRVMIGKPEGYNEADYELLFRAIEAGQQSGFFKLDRMPNRKTDSNNSGGISTDYIGGNWNWTTLGYQEREELALKHENWQRGLVWTLQNHPRVPQAIRDKLAKWGLPKDEFTDNGNWPWQLYVREARRMVADHVMNQQHCTGHEVAEDPVGLAAYSMDSHHVQRVAKDGMVKNEGDVQIGVKSPYPVSYRSLVPKRGECSNLLVPWSISATHMAFGSIRMEPVFMVLGQSAAIAAGLALEKGSGLQEIDYSELKPRLLKAGQALGISPDTPAGVVDNDDAKLVSMKGEWISSTSTPGYLGRNYFHDGKAGQGTKEVFYHLPPGSSGARVVSVRWTSHENRAPNVQIEIHHRDGTTIRNVDQRRGGGRWNPLGEFQFTGSPEQGVVVSNKGANGYVVADAVSFSEFVKMGPAAGENASLLLKELAAGKPRKVVVYGTSLTANGGWVGQMKQWLTASYSGSLEVINSGMSGKNSSEGVARLQEKVLRHQPDTVFIEFAMNDAFLYDDGTPHLSVAEAKANLATMIDAIKKQNPAAEIILQTMNSVWDSPKGSNSSATLRPKLADYYEMYRSMAKERGLLLVDHEPDWSALQKDDPEKFQTYVPDGVHPTPTGTENISLPLLMNKLLGSANGR
jgi:lysophospholipase L1-like esterase